MGNWLHKLSIYRQLVIPILIIGVAGVSAVLYSAFALEDSVVALETMHKQGGKIIAAIEHIEASVIQFRALSLQHLANESSTSMSNIEAELVKSRRDISNNLTYISTNSQDIHTDNIEKTLAFSELVNSYFERMDEVFKQSSDFEKELAFELMTKVESDFHQQVNAHVQALKRHETADISATRDILVSAVSRNLWVTVTISISGGALLILVAFIVTRQITRRLSSLLHWSKTVSNGNWSQPLISQSQDEVGQLTDAMEAMRQNIQHAHSELAQAKDEAVDVAENLRIYANAFENSGESIMITDKDNNIININKAFTHQTGYRKDEVIGKKVCALSE